MGESVVEELGPRMKIHLLRSRANRTQLDEMLEALGSYVKLAVDVRREVVAGGGILHADCESVLIDDGSRQQDVWGADWEPGTQQIHYEALINIRPRQDNPSMEILDPAVRDRIAQIVEPLLEGV